MYAQLTTRTRAALQRRRRSAAAYARNAMTATARTAAIGKPVKAPRRRRLRVPGQRRARACSATSTATSLPSRRRRPAASTGARTCRSPGCRAGEQLTAQHATAARAPTCSRATGRRWPGSTTLAGTIAPRRSSGDGRPDAARGRRAADRHAATPRDAQVGIIGARALLRGPLGGRPGGDLRAGRRACWRTPSPRPRRRCARRSHRRVERAAITALAGRLGGVVAVRPRTRRDPRVRRHPVLGRCSRPARRSRSSR